MLSPWSSWIPIIFIDECRWSRICLTLLFKLLPLFFIENNRTNLFWVHSFLLFLWMCCILLSIVKPRTMFGVLLSKHLFLCPTLALWNFIVPFKIFVRVMIQSPYIYRKKKALFDELPAVDRPFSLLGFNLYVFSGLWGEFRDLVISLSIKAGPFSYSYLHSHLFAHEFFHKNSLQSMIVVITAPLLPMSAQPPSNFVAHRQHYGSSHNSFNSYHGRGRFYGGWQNNNNRNSSNIGFLVTVVLIGITTKINNKVIGIRETILPTLNNVLIHAHLGRMLGDNFAVLLVVLHYEMQVFLFYYCWFPRSYYSKSCV